MPRKNGGGASPQDTAQQLRITIGVFKRRVQETTGVGDLSESQLRVLARLERHGPATTAELARREQMTPQAMGTIIGWVTKQGYVERVPDATDGRRVHLHVTAAGLSAVHSGRSAIVERMSQALETAFTPAEVSVLSSAVPLLQRLSDLI